MVVAVVLGDYPSLPASGLPAAHVTPALALQLKGRAEEGDGGGGKELTASHRA